jgi:alpha-mannosidase
MSRRTLGIAGSVLGHHLVQAQWSAAGGGGRGRTVEAPIDIGFNVNLTDFQAKRLVYGGDGSPVKGSIRTPQWLRIASPANRAEPVELYAEAAENPSIVDFSPTPIGDRDTAGATAHLI